MRKIHFLTFSFKDLSHVVENRHSHQGQKITSEHAASYETFQIRQFTSVGEGMGGIRRGWRREEVLQMGFES